MAENAWNRKYIEARNKIQSIRKSGISNVNDYILMKPEKRFKRLMILYNNMMPNWKVDYKRNENRKPVEIRTELKVRNIVEFIDGAVGEELLVMALSMYASNKIAHESKYIRNEILKYFFDGKVMSGEVAFKGNVNMDIIYSLIERYLDQDVRTDEAFFGNIKGKLNNYGISDIVLQDLETQHGDDLKQAIQMQRAGFYIKDYEMDNIINELKDRDDISYGKYSSQMKDDKGNLLFQKDGTPKMEHRFIMDLPYYRSVLCSYENREKYKCIKPN